MCVEYSYISIDPFFMNVDYFRWIDTVDDFNTVDGFDTVDDFDTVNGFDTVDGLDTVNDFDSVDGLILSMVAILSIVVKNIYGFNAVNVQGHIF